MAETMLYVNEHAHDQLWDGEVPPDWIRSFGPGAYPVLTAANGESVVISGHPAERGTFDRFMSAIGRPELIDDPRFVDVPSRQAHFADLLEILGEWAATISTPQVIEDGDGRSTGWPPARCDRCARCATPTGPRSAASLSRSAIAAAGRCAYPTRRGTSRAATSGVRGEPRYRGEDNRAVLTELLGLDDAELDRLEADGVLSARLPRR